MEARATDSLQLRPSLHAFPRPDRALCTFPQIRVCILLLLHPQVLFNIIHAGRNLKPVTPASEGTPDPEIVIGPGRRKFSKKMLSGVLASLIALFFSGVLIYHLVEEFQSEQIVARLQEIPAIRFVEAILFAALGYLTMTLYDTLGFIWIGKARSAGLPYRKIAFACFTGYAVSNTLGFPSLTGTAVKLRLYTSWGVRVLDAVRVIALSASTTWFGLCIVAGTGLLVHPQSFGAGAQVGADNLWRLLGILILMVPMSYLAACARWGNHVVRFRGREVALPSFPLAVAQILAATADWVFAGLVLYSLLPERDVVFLQYISNFVAAQAAGIASHVPGGAGVFEASILALLKLLGYPAASIVVAVVGFRVVYYLVPFTIACILLAGRELIVHGGHLFSRGGETKPPPKE